MNHIKQIYQHSKCWFKYLFRDNIICLTNDGRLNPIMFYIHKCKFKLRVLDIKLDSLFSYTDKEFNTLEEATSFAIKKEFSIEKN